MSRPDHVTEADAPEAVQQSLSPSAPGLPPESGVPVDLPQVAPVAAPSTRLLVLVGTGSALLFSALTVAVARHASIVTTVDLPLHSWVLV
jgi:hypothetical protein